MAIRLNPERLLGLLIFVLFLIWAVLTAMGCATGNTGVAMSDIDGLRAEIAALKVQIEVPIDLSREITTTTTVPVATGDVAGDVTAITIAGATPWTLAGVLGLLGLFQARRQRTATGTVDRMIGAIAFKESQRETDLASEVREYLKHLGRLSGKPDRIEVFLRSRVRSRLARMKK